MRFRTLVAASLCVAGLGLAACGGSDDSGSGEPTAEQAEAAREINSLGQQLKQAYEGNDAAAACALLDPAGLKQEFGSKKICVKRVTAAISRGEARPQIDFDEITVNGDTATASAKAENGPTSNYEFIRVDGKWYIDISPDDQDSAATSSAGNQ